MWFELTHCATDHGQTMDHKANFQHLFKKYLGFASNRPGEFVVSVKCAQQVEHIRVVRGRGGYRVGGSNGR